MAGKEWSKQEFNNIPSICLKKNSNAIRNKDKRGNQRSTEDDRVSVNNFSLHLSKAASGDQTAKVHGKRLTVGELVKEAFGARDGGEKKTQINLQWLNRDNNSALENACIIPCCDTSEVWNVMIIFLYKCH